MAIKKREFTLEPGDIDEITLLLDTLLEEHGLDKQSRLRICLSIEESLLRMKAHFGADTVVEASYLNRPGRTFIQLKQYGTKYNPLSKEEIYLEDWSGSLLTSIGLSAQYSYSRGANLLKISLPKESINQVVKAVVALVVGVLLGVILANTLTPELQQQAIDRFFEPIYNAWVGILNTFAGPVIFFMVITAILNLSGIEEVGTKSHRVMARYFTVCTLSAVFAVFIAIPMIKTVFTVSGDYAADSAGFFAYLMKVFPENFFTPMIESNTPQILLIAIMIGNGLLYLQSECEGLSGIIRQANELGLLLAEWISKAVPYLIALLVAYLILDKETSTIKRLWMPLIIAVLASIVVMLFLFIYASVKKKVPIKVLVSKLMPAFLTALKNGNLDVGYAQMEDDCEKQLGIERHYANMSLPYGLVLYMPVNIVGALVFTIYAATHTGVEISTWWLLTAVLLTVVVIVATPPVPGANLLAYIVVFTQLGIPAMALTAAMVYDTIFDIFAMAGNEAMLQTELILQADTIGLLDKETLKKPRISS